MAKCHMRKKSKSVRSRIIRKWDGTPHLDEMPTNESVSPADNGRERRPVESGEREAQREFEDDLNVLESQD